jgi:hypothetical protein
MKELEDKEEILWLDKAIRIIRVSTDSWNKEEYLRKRSACKSSSS